MNFSKKKLEWEDEINEIRQIESIYTCVPQ